MTRTTAQSAADSAATSQPLDVQRLRADFPVLATQVHGKPLVYFDNAATSQKPAVVIEAIDRYLRQGL